LPFNSHLFSPRLHGDIWGRNQLRLACSTTILNGEITFYCSALRDTRTV